jgi:hypothetical protein
MKLFNHSHLPKSQFCCHSSHKKVLNNVNLQLTQTELSQNNQNKTLSKKNLENQLALGFQKGKNPY